MCRGGIEGYCLPNGISNIPWLRYLFSILLNMLYRRTAPLTLDFTDHVPAFLLWRSGIQFRYIFVPTFPFVGTNDLSCFSPFYTTYQGLKIV